MRRFVLLACVVALALLLWFVLRDTNDGRREATPRETARDAPARLAGRPFEAPRRTGGGESAAESGEEPGTASAPAVPIPPFRIRAVTEDGGAVLEGVDIVLDYARDGPHVTGPDGEIAIVLPKAGLTAASFQASKPGFLRAGGHASRGELNVVRMRTGVRVSGRVLHAAGDAPVEGAVVRTWTAEIRSETCGASTTDATGAFTLDGVAVRERVWIVARASGLHAVAERRTFTEDEHDLVLRVGRGGTLEGVVRRDDGSAATGIEVWLVRPGMPLPPRREERMWFLGGAHEELRRYYYPAVETNAEGRYAFRGVPLGEDRLPVARISENADVQAEPVRFERDGETLRRDIELPALASLTVKVLDADGSVLPQVQVDFTSPRIWFDLRQVGRANDDGSRTVAGLVPGIWALKAWIPAGEPLEQEVVLDAGADTTVVLEARSGLVLEGQVVDVRGQAVAYAHVSFAGPPYRHATADKAGRFRLTGLRDVEGTLEVEPGFRSEMEGEARERPLGVTRLRDVRPGGDRLRVVLPDGGWLSGRVRGVAAGTELEEGLYSQAVTGRSNCILSESGAFRKEAPRHGVPFVIRFEHSDGRFALVRVAALDAGADHDLGPIVLGPGSTFEGRVLNASGSGVENARVRLVERWTKRDLRTGAGGTYRLERLPLFPVWLRVDAKGFPPAFRVLDPRASGAQDIRLSRGGHLELHVLDADGAPLGEGTFSIIWDVTSEYDADLDDLHDLYRLETDGPTRLRREAGTYRMRVANEASNQIANATAEIRDGETTRVDVRLARVAR